MHSSRQMLQELGDYAHGCERFAEPVNPEFAPGTNFSRKIAFADFFASMPTPSQARCVAMLLDVMADKLAVMSPVLAAQTLEHLAWTGHASLLSTRIHQLVELLRYRLATVSDWTAAHGENVEVVEALLRLISLLSPECFSTAAADVSASIPDHVLDVAALKQDVNHARMALERFNAATLRL